MKVRSGICVSSWPICWTDNPIIMRRANNTRQWKVTSVSMPLGGQPNAVTITLSYQTIQWRSGRVSFSLCPHGRTVTLIWRVIGRYSCQTRHQCLFVATLMGRQSLWSGELSDITMEVTSVIRASSWSFWQTDNHSNLRVSASLCPVWRRENHSYIRPLRGQSDHRKSPLSLENDIAAETQSYFVIPFIITLNWALSL